MSSIRQGTDTHNELRILEASFTNAWALLQFHEHDCDVCQLIAFLDDAHRISSSTAVARPQNPD
jgi:hypothetical protein